MENSKNRFINNVNQLYNKYFDTYKRNCDSEDLNEEDKKFFEPNQFEIFRKKKQKSRSTEQNIKKQMQIPLWFEINREKFEELTRDIYNNQDHRNFKIIIDKRTSDLKNTKKFWMEVTTCEITKSEAKKMYKEFCIFSII